MEQSCLSDMCHWLLLLLDLDGTVGVGGSVWVAIDVSMANDRSRPVYKLITEMQKMNGRHEWLKKVLSGEKVRTARYKLLFVTVLSLHLRIIIFCEF